MTGEKTSLAAYSTTCSLDTTGVRGMWLYCNLRVTVQIPKAIQCTS